MTETTVNMNIVLNCDIHQANLIMKKFLKGLEPNELDIITDAKISQTIVELEVSSDVINEIREE